MTTRKNVLHIIYAALLLNLLIGGAFVGGHQFVSNSAAFEAAELAIRSDSAVSHIVGDVASVKLAFLNYSIKVSDRNGDAYFQTHVVGSRAEADAFVTLQKESGEWKVARIRIGATPGGAGLQRLHPARDSQ